MRFRRGPKRDAGSLDDVFETCELPSFPAIITQALSMLGDPNVAMIEVAEVLEADPGISVRLLSLVNSAAVGLANRIDNIAQAVAMLGRNQVESILISSAARSAVPVPSSAVFDSSRFWRAAASRAVVASSITAVTDPGRQSEAFTAALLQDMAVTVLLGQVPDYDRVLRRWYDGEVADLADAEIEAFGWSHPEAAARMARAWNFPANMIDAIANHHDPIDAQGPTEQLVGTRLVSVWRETDTEQSVALLLDRALQVPELKERDCERLVDQAMGRAGEVAALFC